MTHPTITKELADHDFLKMAVDSMQDDEVEGPRVILGPVALERFAKAVYKLGRNAGLEDAKQTAEDCDVVEAKGNTYYAQLGDAAATQRGIVAAIESLKDNTP